MKQLLKTNLFFNQPQIKKTEKNEILANLKHLEDVNQPDFLLN